MRDRTQSKSSALLAASTTCTPEPARDCASSAPRPRDAPVTTAMRVACRISTKALIPESGITAVLKELGNERHFLEAAVLVQHLQDLLRCISTQSSARSRRLGASLRPKDPRPSTVEVGDAVDRFAVVVEAPAVRRLWTKHTFEVLP
jgi:hypothetical protein